MSGRVLPVMLVELERWSSVQAFYDADSRRARSGESDFGVWWRHNFSIPLTYRISAVHDTGEIYATAFHNSYGVSLGETFLIGRFTPAGQDGGYGGYEDAERILEGWAEKCGEEGSIEWALGRCRPTLAKAPA